MVLSRNRQARTGDVSITVEDEEIIAGKLAALHKFNFTVRYRTLRVYKYLPAKTNPIVQPFAIDKQFCPPGA
jgi:hypothetical protein